MYGYVLYKRIFRSYYPFDRHKCSLTFQSWLYDVRYLNVSFAPQKHPSEQFRENNQFKLLRILFSEEVALADGLEWSLARFSLVIRRRPLYHLFNLVFPCTLLSLITCLVFLGPPDSIDKVFVFRIYSPPTQLFDFAFSIIV